MAIYRGGRRTLTGQGEPDAVIVSCAARQTFCRSSACRRSIGRGFTKEEDNEGGPRTVLLSERFWRSRFGGDRSVIGKTHHRSTACRTP